jgi:hypothetical protein
MGACLSTPGIDLPKEAKEFERSGYAARLVRTRVQEAIEKYVVIAALLDLISQYIYVPDRLVWNSTIGSECVSYSPHGRGASRGSFRYRDLIAQLRSAPTISQFHSGDKQKCIWEIRITSKHTSGVICSIAHPQAFRFGPINGIFLDEEGDLQIQSWTSHGPPFTPAISSEEVNICPFKRVIGFRFSADLVQGTVEVIAIRHDLKMALLFTLSMAPALLKDSHPVCCLSRDRAVEIRLVE